MDRFSKRQLTSWQLYSVINCLTQDILFLVPVPHHQPPCLTRLCTSPLYKGIVNLLPENLSQRGELTGALNQHKEEHSYLSGLWALLGRLRTLQQTHPAPQPSELLLGRASTVSCGHTVDPRISDPLWARHGETGVG